MKNKNNVIERNYNMCALYKQIKDFISKNSLKVSKAQVYVKVIGSDYTYRRLCSLLRYKSQIVPTCKSIDYDRIDEYLSLPIFDNFVMRYIYLEIKDYIVSFSGYTIRKPENPSHVYVCCIFYNYTLYDICHTLTLEPYIELIEGSVVDNDISLTFTTLFLIGEYINVKHDDDLIGVINSLDTSNIPNVLARILVCVYKECGVDIVPEEIISLTKKLSAEIKLSDNKLRDNVPLLIYSSIIAYGEDRFDNWRDYWLLFPEDLKDYTGIQLYDRLKDEE